MKVRCIDNYMFEDSLTEYKEYPLIGHDVHLDMYKIIDDDGDKIFHATSRFELVEED